MGIAELAVLIGLVNGLILIIRPVGRLHLRIDRLEYQVTDIKGDVDRILGASGISSKKQDG